MADEPAGEARRRGIPKAALIGLLSQHEPPAGGIDPIDAAIGAGDGDPVDDIDAVAYGR